MAVSFSHSITWILGSKFKLSELVTGAFIHRGISLTWKYYFVHDWYKENLIFLLGYLNIFFLGHGNLQIFLCYLNYETFLFPEWCTKTLYVILLLLLFMTSFFPTQFNLYVWFSLGISFPSYLNFVIINNVFLIVYTMNLKLRSAQEHPKCLSDSLLYCIKLL